MVIRLQLNIKSILMNTYHFFNRPFNWLSGIILLPAVVFLSQISCTKLVSNINNNPNVPTDADALTMLPGIETADMLLQGGDLARTTSTWSGYCTGELLQSSQIQEYNVKAGNFDDTWFLVYGAVIKNARIMREKARAINNRALVGLSQLIEAHAVLTATDLWGDIPFTQAFSTDNPEPAYDPQQSVYEGVQSLLDSAISELSNGAPKDFGNQDIFFAGSTTAMSQVAYTLKARAYLHIKEYDKAYSVAQNGISTNQNQWLAPYPATTKGNTNPWNQYISIDRSGSLDGKNAYAVGLLNPESIHYRGNAKTNETARYSYYYTGSLPVLNADPDGFFGAATSFPMVSYEENLLILAECAARTKGMEGLQQLNNYRAYLDEGGYLPTAQLKEETYSYAPYTPSDFAAGGIVNTTGLSPEKALLKNILEERYIAFIGQPEGFNDLRRTRKESDINVKVPPNKGTLLPQRFLYPQGEVDGNKSIPNPIPDLFTPTQVNQ